MLILFYFIKKLSLSLYWYLSSLSELCSLCIFSVVALNIQMYVSFLHLYINGVLQI